MKLSKIYNLHAMVDDRFKDNNFKEREARAFEIKYPEARIIKDQYRHEKELDDDWQKYCELPYHLKVLANEVCLRLYGMKNEQQYLKLKAYFTKKDIENDNLFENIYTPGNLRENADISEDWMDKQATDYMNSGGHSLLRINYDDLSDLNNDWYNFNNQPYKHKVVANNKSLEIYGKTVPEVYQIEIKKFLQKDIKNSSLDDLDMRPVINDSLAATEAVCEAIQETKDPIEAIALLELAKTKISSPVERSIVELAETQTKMVVNGDYENYLGYYNYLLPQEIISIYENTQELENDPMFLNYCLRGLGFQPVMKGFQEEVRKIVENEKEDIAKLVRIGWNPILEGTPENRFKSATRANKVLKENMNCIFIDITFTVGTPDPKPDILKGISMIMIHELDPEYKEKTMDLPKVLITLDYSDPNWYPLMYGKLLSKQSVDEVISRYKWPSVTCFFVELSDILYDRIMSIGIDQFNQSSIIQKLCSLLHVSSPDIGNKKLLFYYLLNALLAGNDESFIIKDKFIVQTIYSKFKGNYNEILQSFDKLKSFKNTELPIKESTVFDNAKFILDEFCVSEEANDYFRLAKPNYTDSWPLFRNVLNLQF